MAGVTRAADTHPLWENLPTSAYQDIQTVSVLSVSILLLNIDTKKQETPPTVHQEQNVQMDCDMFTQWIISQQWKWGNYKHSLNLENSQITLSGGNRTQRIHMLWRQSDEVQN